MQKTKEKFLSRAIYAITSFTTYVVNVDHGELRAGGKKKTKKKKKKLCKQSFDERKVDFD